MRNKRIPPFVAVIHRVSAPRSGPSRAVNSEAMVSSAPTIEASTSTKIVNTVMTRSTKEKGVKSSLSTRLVNQSKRKPASNEVSVVSWMVAWPSAARRLASFGL